MLRFALALSLLAAASIPALAQTKKIVVLGYAPADIQKLQKMIPNAKIVSADSPDQLMREIVDADGLIGLPYELRTEILKVAKKLQWIHSPSAGVENYITPELQKTNITLTNGKILMGPEIADHAFAMLLALTRRIDFFMGARQREEWGLPRQGSPIIELRGKTAVVIGVGGIGTQIAERAHAFGMKVIGVDPKDIPYMSAIERVVLPDQLDKVLPLADVVFVSAPHTPESEKMIGKSQFELMKKNAYFIAVSRGKLYDMDGLVKALDSRRLSGAGVDVTDPEPLPKGHPLWKFDNVIITPHIATISDKRDDRMFEVLSDNVQRFVNGKTMRNVVDKKKGY